MVCKSKRSQLQLILNSCVKEQQTVVFKMEGTSQLIWAMLFGAIGLGFFIYGKKQKAIVPLISGIVLFIFPYFISNVFLLVFVGAVFVALPYFVRI